MTGIKLEPCLDCGGTGRIPLDRVPCPGWCPTCNGSGRAVSEHVEPAPEAGVVGWKLVPIEPTEDMCSAGYGYLPVSPGGRRNAERWAYSAMLAASPPPPSDPVVQKLVEALRKIASLDCTREQFVLMGPAFAARQAKEMVGIANAALALVGEVG
jgi:hypothetical protein